MASGSATHIGGATEPGSQTFGQFALKSREGQRKCMFVHPVCGQGRWNVHKRQRKNKGCGRKTFTAFLITTRGSNLTTRGIHLTKRGIMNKKDYNLEANRQ